MKMFLLRIHFWLVIFVSTYTLTTVDTSEIKECEKPKCFIYAVRNASLPISVSLNGKDSLVTTFCFKGVTKSFLRLWVNPVIARDPATINESSKFVWYYGTSVLDVETRSQQPGYRMLQEMAAKLRPLKQTDDLSLDPFNISCVSIDTNVEYKVNVKIKAADLWYISYLIIGTLIFFWAKSWSQ